MNEYLNEYVEKSLSKNGIEQIWDLETALNHIPPHKFLEVRSDGFWELLEDPPVWFVTIDEDEHVS